MGFCLDTQSCRHDDKFTSLLCCVCLSPPALQVLKRHSRELLAVVPAAGLFSLALTGVVGRQLGLDSELIRSVASRSVALPFAVPIANTLQGINLRLEKSLWKEEHSAEKSWRQVPQHTDLFTSWSSSCMHALCRKGCSGGTGKHHHWCARCKSIQLVAVEDENP